MRKLTRRHLRIFDHQQLSDSSSEMRFRQVLREISLSTKFCVRRCEELCVMLMCQQEMGKVHSMSSSNRNFPPKQPKISRIESAIIRSRWTSI